jgi:hypothetical protein
LLVEFDGVSMDVESFCWDSVRIGHDLASLPEAALDWWFDRWMDPEDTRGKPELGVIHSLSISTNVIGVDFGTAMPAALYELLHVLGEAGATRLRLSSDRIEKSDEG